MFEPEVASYTAALQAGAFYEIPTPGYLRVSGPDQQTFIQRQTTNDALRLGAGQVQLSVLTSPTARILDVFYLLHEPESIGLITLPGRGESTFRFLKSRIFFMDKVSLENASAGTSLYLLSGPRSGEALSMLGLAAPEAGRLAALEDGDLLRVWRSEGTASPGFHLLVPGEARGETASTLEAAGLRRLDHPTFEVLRVEAGIPGGESELTEEYTPLEAGLEAAVSGEKGCYTGQEILARQVTYDKVTQRLSGLRLTEAAAPGARLWSDGKPAGSLTSLARSPRFGLIGLGIVKRPYFEPGTSLTVGEDRADGSAAIVAALPFQ
jgi:folate-binding protein YgfZ